MKSNYSLILFATAFSMTVVSSGYALTPTETAAIAAQQQREHGAGGGTYQGTGGSRGGEYANLNERNAAGQAVSITGTCKQAPKFTPGGGKLTYDLKEPIFDAMRSFVEKYKDQKAEVTVEEPMNYAAFQEVFAQAFGQKKADGKSFYDSIVDANLKSAVDALAKAYADGMKAAYDKVKDPATRLATAKAIGDLRIASGLEKRQSDKTFLKALKIHEAVDGNNKENAIGLQRVEGNIVKWLAGCDASSVSAGITGVKTPPPTTPKLKDLPEDLKKDKALTKALASDKNTSPENVDKIASLTEARDKVLNNPASSQEDIAKANQEFQKGVSALDVGGKVKGALLSATSHQKDAAELLGTDTKDGALKKTKDGFDINLANAKTAKEVDALGEDLKKRYDELKKTSDGVNGEIAALEAIKDRPLTNDEQKTLKGLKKKKVDLDKELDKKNEDSFAHFEAEAQQKIKALRETITETGSFDSKASKSKAYKDLDAKMDPFRKAESDRRNLSQASADYYSKKFGVPSRFDTDQVTDADGHVISGEGISDEEAQAFIDTPDSQLSIAEREAKNKLKSALSEKQRWEAFSEESKSAIKDLGLSWDEERKLKKTVEAEFEIKDGIREHSENNAAKIREGEESLTSLKAEKADKVHELKKAQAELSNSNIETAPAAQKKVEEAQRALDEIKAKIKRETQVQEKVKTDNTPATVRIEKINELTKPSQSVPLLKSKVNEVDVVSVSDAMNVSIPDLRKILKAWKSQQRTKTNELYKLDSVEARDKEVQTMNENIRIIEEEIARKQIILDSLK